MDTWKVIVEAAKKQSYAPVLELPESKSSSNESDGLPPDICYHRQCYQIFATKNLLKRIKKKSEDPTADEKTNQEELKIVDRSLAVIPYWHCHVTEQFNMFICWFFYTSRYLHHL